MKAILKSVSRSFYLTISFLPRPLREPVSLAYLLARATDTIADTATVPAAIRLTTLRDFARVIAGELDFNAVAAALQDFAAQQSDPHERTLIENLRECLEWLAKARSGGPRRYSRRAQDDRSGARSSISRLAIRRSLPR